ncbi:MAG: GntR family transcriptional regulator [Puniceicoccales bacterium]
MNKREKIVQTFRDDIAEGRLKAGDRLPVRKQIELRFDASLVTVQKAMDLLIQEGWLTSHGCNGTCVSESPPHLRRYGLYFGHSPDDGNKSWVRLWTNLLRVSEEVFNRNGLSLEVYYGDHISRDLKQFNRFHDAVRKKELAGMISASWPIPQGDILTEGPHPIPCAAFSSSTTPGMLSMKIHMSPLFSRACEIARELDRRKMALIVPDMYFAKGVRESSLQSMAEHQLLHHTGWIQPLAPRRYPEAVHAQIELLFSDLTPSPDVLYLGDDNYVEIVAEGLRKIGKKVPDDVEVICWGTLPWDEEYSIPVRKIGVDLNPYLMAAKKAIDEARTTQSIPETYEGPEIIGRVP